MSRNAVLVRDAVPEDVEALYEVWAQAPGQHTHERDCGRLGDGRSAVDAADVTRASVAQIAADPDQRLLVAVIGQRTVGAVHLIRAPLSPIGDAAAVHVAHLHVLDSHRRLGVGHALMEATVSWAEEKDIEHVLAAASVSSRDANRFMARLGLGQVAVIRAASVGTLRAKLPADRPTAARVGAVQRPPHGHRSIGAVLAQRRSQRRSEGRTRTIQPGAG
ncbi:MAG TPA: GNAT family N-acetyltransferase [Nocardioidaceae bacterium]|nr:GNAT family N-acetyltransferase [Nocardioidaceae bacterium]